MGNMQRWLVPVGDMMEGMQEAQGWEEKPGTCGKGMEGHEAVAARTEGTLALLQVSGGAPCGELSPSPIHHLFPVYKEGSGAAVCPGMSVCVEP